MATILFQPLNGIGLGHISRLAAIALAVRAHHKDARVLFGLEGGSHLLLESLDLPYLSIPARIEPNSLQWTGWSEPERFGLRRRITEAILLQANPDLVVFDCIPSESFARAAIAQRRPIAICVRPLKHVDEYCRRFQAVLENAKLILLPCEEGEWRLPESLMGKARFVGQVARPLERAGPNAPAKLCNSPFVLITGGGGGYPGTAEFYNMALLAGQRCQADFPSLGILLITGPLFREWNLLEPVQGAKIIPFVPDMPALLASATAAVIQGGYNTVAEVLGIGVPSLCVPALRGYDDQMERAHNTAGKRASFRVFTGTSPEACAEELKALLVSPRSNPAAETSTSGARLAADALAELIPSGSYQQ